MNIFKQHTLPHAIVNFILFSSYFANRSASHIMRGCLAYPDKIFCIRYQRGQPTLSSPGFTRHDDNDKEMFLLDSLL